MDIRVAPKGQSIDGALTKGRLALVRDTDKKTLLAQIVFPGVEEGMVLELQSLEFLKVVKALFPEITQLDPKNLPDPDPVAQPRPGVPNLTGYGPSSSPVAAPNGPAPLPLPPTDSASLSSSAPPGTSVSNGPEIPGAASSG